MKRFFVVFSCFISTIAFIGCTEPIGEQTIIGTLDSVPYYADDYSPHFVHQFADWFFDWAPTIRTENGTEYIIKRKMFKSGGDLPECDGSTDETNWFYIQHIFVADRAVYKGDTIKVTGLIRKRHYGGNKRFGIGGGDYLWIEGGYADVQLVSRGEVYRQLSAWRDSVSAVYQDGLVP